MIELTVYEHRLAAAVRIFERKKPEHAAQLQHATLVEFGAKVIPPDDPTSVLRKFFNQSYHEKVRLACGWPSEHEVQTGS